MSEKLFQLLMQEFPAWTSGEKVGAVCFRWGLLPCPQEPLPIELASYSTKPSAGASMPASGLGGCCLPPHELELLMKMHHDSLITTCIMQSLSEHVAAI